MPFTDPTAANRRLWAVLYAGIALSAVLVALAIYTLLARNTDRNQILDRLSEQVQQSQEQAAANQQSRQASSCTNFRNQRAVEEAVRDIARLNGIKSGQPRVIASKATVADCKAAGTPIGADGLPIIEPAA